MLEYFRLRVFREVAARSSFRRRIPRRRHHPRPRTTPPRATPLEPQNSNLKTESLNALFRNAAPSLTHDQAPRPLDQTHAKSTQVVSSRPQAAPLWTKLNALGHNALNVVLLLIGASLSPAMLRRVGWKPMAEGLILWIAVAAASLAAIHTGWIKA